MSIEHEPLLVWFLATIFSFSMTLMGGYVVLRATTWLDEAECAALGGVVGVALAAGVAWSGFLLGYFGRGYSLSLVTLIVGLSVGLARYRQRRLFSGLTMQGWPAYLTWGLLALSTQSLLPIYAGGGWYGDWWMHFDLAQFYLGQRSIEVSYFGQYSVFSRTPLFNLAMAFYLTLWGHEFAVYQFMTLIPNGVFVPLFLALIKPKRVWLMGLLLALNPFIWLNVLYPWPKLLAAAYILASLWLYLRPQTPAWAWGGCMGLAILSHPAALFYGLGLMVEVAWSKRSTYRMVGSHLLTASLAMVGVGLPWFVWGWWHTGTWLFMATSLAKRKPFDGAWWLVERGLNLVVTFIPYDLFRSLVTLQLPPFELSSLDPIFHYYYNTLPGAMTTILSLYLLRQAWPSWFRAMASLGVLGGVLLQPGLAQHGVAPESMAPLGLLGLVLVGRGLDTMRYPQWVLGILGIEFALSRGLHTVMLAGYFFPITEANFQLKQTQALLFIRDGLSYPGGVMVGVGLIYALLCWGVWRELQQNYDKT